MVDKGVVDMTYCDKCGKKQSTELRQLQSTFDVKGIPIYATIDIRVCIECNEEVWDEDLERKNEKIVFSIYREKAKLLQPEQIKAIRDKYGLSQSAFARLLGFGEKTITRYENGSIQDYSHDNLIRLCDDLASFERLLSLRSESLSESELKRLHSYIEELRKLPYSTASMVNALYFFRKLNPLDYSYQVRPIYQTSINNYEESNHDRCGRDYDVIK
jgi:putative zinc finger/helix-turn-helix YgiT family protein